VKLSKCKGFIKDYSTSVLTGLAILLGLVALAASIHHAFAMAGIIALISITIYFIWRLL
jgi:hypothetical protein|tara:strand:+ start:2024 stop:2200 length:177 start_codon:yes stop_codon:yes gene_type:complete